jgi:sulfate transport system ATP-binding protein
MSISIQKVSRRFGRYTALQEVSLDIAKGELVSLLGPSGSGKTTLLRIIAGLERTDDGQILLNGEVATHIPVRKRRVGFVFQHYALFRHMSVFDNIAFGLKVLPMYQRPTKAAIRKKVLDLLGFVKLEGLESRFPNQLSGGQRQRVALARALAIDPQVLLLDEPFGALDAKVRTELRRWLRGIHEALGITTVFVTHDQEEALEVADRVVVMRQARIEQVGTPQEVYDYPATPFVHEFLGKSNTLQASLDQGRPTIGNIPVNEDGAVPAVDGPLLAFVRPHNVDLARQCNGIARIEVRVLHVHSAGPIARVGLERIDTGEGFEAELSRQQHDALKLAPGEIAYAALKDVRLYSHHETHETR